MMHKNVAYNGLRFFCHAIVDGVILYKKQLSKLSPLPLRHKFGK